MTYQYKNGALHVEDVALAHIAAKIPTPCYIYSAGIIRDRVTRLMDAVTTPWPDGKKPFIAFACKSNSNLAILNYLGKLGTGMDIVSGGELIRCLAAGIPADKIIFSGVGKTDHELRLALDKNIHQINVESEAELARLDEISRDFKKTVHIALRFTPDVDSGAHEKTSTGEEENKFGLMEDEVFRLFKEYEEHPYLRLNAISMHIGSGVPSLEPFREAFLKMSDLVQKLRYHGATITQVDLGGGLWIPYQDEPFPNLQEYGQMIYDIFSPLDVKIALEPGRILVAESGCLLTSVIFNKARTSKRFVIVDAAMNDLIRPTLYDAYHKIMPVVETDADTSPCDIVGPVCETGDYLALDRELPEFQRGDLLAIMNAGAYGSVMSSTYNSRPLVAEILVNGGDFHVIREAQKLEDCWANEKIPTGLK